MVQIEMAAAVESFGSTEMLEPIHKKLWPPGNACGDRNQDAETETTSAVSESPQKNNQAWSLRVHRMFRQQLSCAKTGQDKFDINLDERNDH